MPAHKASLDKRKKTENISNIFSDGNDMTLGINYKKKKVVKATNTRRLSNILLNNQWVTEAINEEVPNKQPKLTPKATRKGISKA